MPNLDRASRLLQDLPTLWNHPGVTPAQQRGLAREVFQEVRLREGRLVAVRPRPKYAPLFAYALWRQHVAGGAGSSWPGLGRLMLQGITSRDFPIIQATVLAAGFFYIFTSLVVDILYAYVNPRIRFE